MDISVLEKALTQDPIPKAEKRGISPNPVQTFCKFTDFIMFQIYPPFEGDLFH